MATAYKGNGKNNANASELLQQLDATSSLMTAISRRSLANV